jgi:acyl carrier protein
MTDTRTKIIETIAQELEVSQDLVTESANITEDLGADSLDIVELIMALEEHFDMSIEDEAAEQMNTVQDVIDYIEKAKS